MIKIIKYSETKISDILTREIIKTGVEQTVADIISDVIKNGDEALLIYCKKFDGADIKELKVSEEEMQLALDSVQPEFLEILEKAAQNIREFHTQQVRQSFILNNKNGVVTGQKIIPIEKAGIYVPGGTAAYPSTVLMDSIPAKIAGVKDIIMTTPPKKDGSISPVILAAAKIAGVTQIYKVGGAQAIAALCYGTESVPKVDKIVGPGNAFVAEAKRQVFGQVSIDMIAGPSEILVISDENGDPDFIAADLLSQAEHDKMASAVLVTTSEKLANEVRDSIEAQLETLERQEIARASIDSNGKIIITDSIDEAIEISNAIAPEHLELCLKDPFAVLSSVKNAGSVFMGKYCMEALGDYFTGANHTLPTNGTARFSSPLSVDDFIKKMQYTYYTKDALLNVARDVAFFAEKEGLTAHARSVTIRMDKDKA